ncbi:CaiB/BaiF CoA-transferase family protein [Nocardioides sp. BP30]|uniref:CaiB/BaiF CoA transferase family protein n=1 Tax=Nocardioides sp. BP30 TaxID=3036374 RepID=UPI0024698BC3|nr:CaiB/BaiF CoA-transferase family protein [Nocardioides sp. BP30]WGL54013.1 CaiB/BaiF CoA-transferase family protein [Nocardioides sp. BP30]
MTSSGQRSVGPLAGLRVLEIAGIGPAPYASLLLAELGADVVRIDRPAAVGAAPEPSDALNRSRPSVAIDLKQPDGRDLVLRMVRGADVLIEGLRPGVMERLGLGPEHCADVNDRLIYGRMTGWGQDGPLSHTAGHDITYAALTGALHATGGSDKPRNALNLIGDFGGGTMFLLLGILSALHERTRSGRGQVVDAAMVDGAASLMTMMFGMHAVGSWRDEREANLLDGGTPFYDTYRCRDGRFVAVGALEPQFFAELMKQLELDFDQDDVAGWPRMRAAMAKRFAERDRDEWAAVFEGTDACVAPVLGLEEAPLHPHVAAREVFVPYAGGYQPRVAPVFSRTPALRPGDKHVPGEDSRAVLVSVGLSAEEIDALIAAGTVRQS